MSKIFSWYGEVVRDAGMPYVLNKQTVTGLAIFTGRQCSNKTVLRDFYSFQRFPLQPGHMESLTTLKAGLVRMILASCTTFTLLGGTGQVPTNNSAPLGWVVHESPQPRPTIWRHNGRKQLCMWNKPRGGCCVVLRQV